MVESGNTAKNLVKVLIAVKSHRTFYLTSLVPNGVASVVAIKDGEWSTRKRRGLYYLVSGVHAVVVFSKCKQAFDFKMVQNLIKDTSHSHADTK